MSLASEYAARQAVAAAADVTANESAPPSFTGPNVSMFVDPQGNLRVRPSPGTNEVVAPPAAALAVAQWIMDTFSD